MKKIRFFFTALVLLVMTSSIAFAQRITVSGTVTDAASGDGLVGVSVLLKGSATVYTMTDALGNYKISVPSDGTLVFNTLGYQSTEIAVNGQTTVNAVLTIEAEALDEAVVTIAYGAAKKSTLTGAISSVNAEKIAIRPTSSVASALEGSVTGLQVGSTYGAPGTDPSIRIRGIGTVNGSSSPLYVIDGVPFGGNISDINPTDIESLTVLKDAASAALYGNRASNGVILITTKSAKSNRLSVNLDIKQGVYQRATKDYKMASTNEYMELQWQNLRNYRMSKGDSAEEAATYAGANLINDMLYLNIYNKANDALFTADGKLVSDATILPGYTDDLNWFDQAIRNGYRQEYNLSASSASEKSDAYFSVGYLDENGYLSNSSFNRFTGRAVVNMKPASYMKVGLNLSGSHQNSLNSSGVGDGSSSYVNPFMYCRNIAPIYPVHLHDVTTGEYILDVNGNKQFDPGSYTDASGAIITTRNQYADRHVIWENMLDRNETVRNTMDGIAYLDLYFLKDFTFTIKGNMNVRTNDKHTYNNAIIGDGKGNGGRASKTIYRYKNYTIQEQLRWTHTFDNVHTLNVLLGHENYYYNYDYAYNYKTTEAMTGQGNLSNFTVPATIDGYEVNYRTESYLGRVRYNYNDRYNVEASFRRDGSSRFHNRWGNFWSLGANWMISNEDFMKDIKWVNSLKLRADYGEVGNDAGAGYYGYMYLYELDQNNNLGAYYLTQLPNYDLKWETGQSWGVGVEARLFNRWNINVDYFDKRNKDLLFDVYNPLSAGATSNSNAESVVTQNLGTISNHGIEIETDIDVIRNRDWRLNVNMNATFIRNKVVKLPDANKDGIISAPHKIEEGRDRYAYYLYQWAGVDQMTGQSVYLFNDKDYYITSDNTANGEVLFGSKVDENGVANTLMKASNYEIINGVPYVGVTTYAKRDFSGSSLPKVYGSFGFNLDWKALTLSTLFTYSLGGKTYDAVYSSLMSASSTPASMHSDLKGSWFNAPEGMTADSANRIDPNGIPEINYGTSSDNNAGTSTRWLTSSNYLVLKNISLSYRLPKSWANAIEMQGITVSASCENALTFTARQGMNPQQLFSGYQYNYLPPARVLTASVSFRF